MHGESSSIFSKSILHGKSSSTFPKTILHEKCCSIFSMEILHAKWGDVAVYSTFMQRIWIEDQKHRSSTTEGTPRCVVLFLLYPPIP